MMNESAVTNAAAAYLKRGWQPIPIPTRSKRPVLDEWQNYRASAESLSIDFSSNTNIGLLLGEMSDWLVDVDLDWLEARRLAAAFLPETDLYSGRKSSQRSHRWYVAIGVTTKKYRDLTFTKQSDDPDDKGMIVELRSSGAQTVVEPSIHPSGEAVAWEVNGEPTTVDANELRQSVAQLAAYSLIARHWPARGTRHEISLPLAGTLLRAGWSEEEATTFICRAAEVAGDEEWRDRARDVSTTAKKLAAGVAVTGIPRLAEFLDRRVVDSLTDWLGIDSQSPNPTHIAWGTRRELPALDTEVPLLREELLPEAIRPWIADAAERLQVPLEYIAVPTIVAAASVIGRTVGIYPKRYDDWCVVPNLWGAIVGRPGFLKSPALSEGTRPLRQLSATAAEDFKAREAERDAKKAVIKAQLDAVRGKMKKDITKPDLLRNHEEEFATLRREGEVLERGASRYSTNDSTVAKLGMLLAENPRGLLLMRDELVGWIRTLDKQGNEGDRAFYLESWNGFGVYETDRVERGSLRVPALCLSILGSIQPGRLLPYILDATEGGERDDGLLQRFQLMVYPEHTAAWKEVDRWPDTEARQRVNRIFTQLDQLVAEDLGFLAKEDGEEGDEAKTPAIHFDDAGQELFRKWYGELEHRIRSGEIQSQAFESHIAKYRSLVPSLALIFHAINVMDGATPSGVPVESVWMAVEWSKYLEKHAEKIYAASLRRDLHAAHALAHKLEKGEIEDGQTVRSIKRRQWSQLRHGEDVEAGLEVLEQTGWLRLEEEKTAGRSREIVRIHPDLHQARTIE